MLEIYSADIPNSRGPTGLFFFEGLEKAVWMLCHVHCNPLISLGAEQKLLAQRALKHMDHSDKREECFWQWWDVTKYISLSINLRYLWFTLVFAFNVTSFYNSEENIILFPPPHLSDN